MTDEQNKETMKEAVETLDQISNSHSTPKTIKKSITDLINDLNHEEYSLSVRAANAISVLDDITQDPNMPSLASSIKTRGHKRINPL